MSDEVKGTEKFVKAAEGLAKYAFGVMRLYCMEHKLSRAHLVDAIASLCIEIRDSYPEGPEEFDRLAEVAQLRYERSKP